MSADPSRRWRLVLGTVVGISLIELVAAGRSYRDTIDARDVATLRAALDTTPGMPVVADRNWLDPLARMEFPAAAASYGLPDLRDAPEFWVIGRPGDPAWSAEASERFGLDADPFLLERVDAGGLSAAHLSQGDRAATRVDGLVERDDLEVRVDGRRCNGGRKRAGPRRPVDAFEWDCRPGKVEVRYVEVDLAARRCLAFSDFDGRSVELRAPGFVFGDALFGHVGFGDFNGRLRSEATATVDVEIEGQGVASMLVADAQGWASFDLDTQSDIGDLRVRVTPTLSGTFDGSGNYTRRPARDLCFELRAVQRGQGASR